MISMVPVFLLWCFMALLMRFNRICCRGIRLTEIWSRFGPCLMVMCFGGDSSSVMSCKRVLTEIFSWNLSVESFPIREYSSRSSSSFSMRFERLWRSSRVSLVSGVKCCSRSSSSHLDALSMTLSGAFRSWAAT